MTRNPISGIKSLFHRYKHLRQSITRYITDNITWLNSKHRETFHVIKYEDLIQNTQQVIKSLQDFVFVIKVFLKKVKFGFFPGYIDLIFLNIIGFNILSLLNFTQ